MMLTKAQVQALLAMDAGELTPFQLEQILSEVSRRGPGAAARVDDSESPSLNDLVAQWGD